MRECYTAVATVQDAQNTDETLSCMHPLHTRPVRLRRGCHWKVALDPDSPPGTMDLVQLLPGRWKKFLQNAQPA